MATTIAICNHKGGVGKTTTAHTLGAYFALAGYRTLLIDMDSQGSLTQACGVYNCAGASMAEVLGALEPGDLALADIIVNLGDNLDIAPADIALVGTQMGLVTRIQREYALHDALAPVRDKYDLIFIDCPPGQGLLTANALTAADGAICPITPSKQDVDGLALFARYTFLPVVDELNPHLKLIGVLVTQFNARRLLDRAIIQDLKDTNTPLLQVIGESVRVREAPGVHETILTYDPDNPRAHEYSQLGYEVGKWVENAMTP